MKSRDRVFVYGAFLEFALSVSMWADAQSADGNTGINQANTMIRGYFEAATNLMYGVAALVALVGAIKVYQKMANGDHDTGKVAISWFGSCVFLVIVATVIKSFFGIN